MRQIVNNEQTCSSVIQSQDIANIKEISIQAYEICWKIV